MKKNVLFMAIVFGLLAMSGCSVTRVIPWQKSVIPGRYEYVHSWTYPSPEGGYTITCSESGTIDFKSYGRFVDKAVQYHVANIPGEPCWTFDYECYGSWDVRNDHFMFCEYPQNFVMDLMGVNIDYDRSLDWAAGMANRLVVNSTPSARWISFDIVRLNEREFTWSYTYPDGHTDYWEMHRVD